MSLIDFGNLGLWFLHMHLTAAWYGYFAVVISLLFCLTLARIAPFCALPGVYGFATRTPNQSYVNMLYSLAIVILFSARPFDLSYMMFFVFAAINVIVIKAASIKVFTIGIILNAFILIAMLCINLVAIAHLFHGCSVEQTRGWLLAHCVFLLRLWMY